MLHKMAQYDLNHYQNQNLGPNGRPPKDYPPDGDNSRFQLTTVQWLLSILLLWLLIVGVGVILFLAQLRAIQNEQNKLDLDFVMHEQQQEAVEDGYVMINLGTPRGDRQMLKGTVIVEQKTPIAQFLGVPYADKPKRFRRAQPSPKWSGVREALDWPANCMQSSVHQYDYLTKIFNDQVSEDCLYLNVWTPLRALPGTGPSHRLNSTKLPVIVFIHGGGFSYMGISMEAFYGGIIASLGNVVLVTVNYRVGLFGFFNNELEPSYGSDLAGTAAKDIYSKNLGLYDQALAIEWVKQNAIYFGGNPDQITLQGQSAGAISIGLHMISPVSSSLFQRAILQSASPMMLKQMFAVNHFDQLLELTNCTLDHKTEDPEDEEEETADLADDYAENSEEEEDSEESEDYDAEESATRRRQTECLERLPAEVLNLVQQQMLRQNAISFGPVTPSQMIPQFADEVLRKAAENGNSGSLIRQKQILLGANSNESTLYMHHENKDLFPMSQQRLVNISREVLTDSLRHLMGNSGTTDRFAKMVLNELERNGQSDLMLVEKFFQFLSDLIFKGPVYKFGEMLSEDPTKQIYLYMFNQTVDKYPDWIGAAHWVEMDFAFGMPLLHPEQFTDGDREISTRMIKTWTHFARTGEMLPQLGVEWPQLNSNHTHRHMSLQSGTASLGYDLNMQYYRMFDIMYDSY